jgi:hypothetical protein
MERLPVVTPAAVAASERFTAALRAGKSRARELLAAQQTRLEQAEQLIQRELERLEEELAARRSEADHLRSECDTLVVRLAHAEARPGSRTQRPTDGSGDHGGVDADADYQRRYEMALDDLHELKEKNAELQQQLAKATANAGNLASPAPAPRGRLDWEAEKRRILAALEADFDQHDAQQFGQRLKIEEVLHATEQIVAEKDRQIEDLKRQLEEQRGTPRTDDSETTTAQRVIANDAAVREERERLKQLQDQWREKLRQAEIELSLERAKLARQRAELAEQLKAAGIDAPRPPAPVTSTGHEDRPTCGRWLAQLGLTEADKERRRRR